MTFIGNLDSQAWHRRSLFIYLVIGRLLNFGKKKNKFLSTFKIDLTHPK